MCLKQKDRLNNFVVVLKGLQIKILCDIFLLDIPQICIFKTNNFINAHDFLILLKAAKQ